MTSIFIFPYPKRKSQFTGYFNHNTENHIHASSLLCSASSWFLTHLTADPGRSIQVSVSLDHLKHSQQRTFVNSESEQNSWSRSQRAGCEPALLHRKKKFQFEFCIFTHHRYTEGIYRKKSDLQESTYFHQENFKKLLLLQYGRREVWLMAVYNWH